MRTYRAIIHKIDRDYNSHAGVEEVTVKSWEEAEEYCRGHDWSGHDYYVYGLIDDSLKVGYFSKKEFKDKDSATTLVQNTGWSYL